MEAAARRLKKIRRFLSWLLVEETRWHLLRFLLPGIAAVAFGVWWWLDISSVQDVAVNALKADLVPTRQRYKGLEALMLSDSDKITLPDKATVEHDFKTKFQEFQGIVEDAIKSGGLYRSKDGQDGKDSGRSNGQHQRDRQGAVTANRGADLQSGEVPSITVASQGDSLSAKYLTDAQTRNGFLFFPAFVLSSNIPSVGTVKDPTIIEEAKKAPGIRCQLLAAQKIDDALRGFGSKKVFDATRLDIEATPVQVYYITSSGVIRLYATGLWPGQSQVDYYQPQFPTNSFFPDRPYFWPTIWNRTHKDLHGKNLVKDLFEITRPYFDLGGNGLVVTLSVGVNAPGIDSGLFLDFKLNDRVTKRIVENLKKVGVSATETSWELLKNTDPKVVEPHNQPLEDAFFEEFQPALKYMTENQSLSDLFGDIHRFRTGNTFVVPLGRGKTTNGDRNPNVYTFLYCELEPESLRLRGAMKLFACGAGLVVALVFVGLSFRQYELKLRDRELTLTEHREFLARVRQIMSDTPLAYCRLNSEDQFQEINEVFATLLGYQSKEQAEAALIGKKRFAELLADEVSQREYERIQHKRAHSEPTGKYDLKLTRADRTGEIDVIVHAADLPGRKGFPETFGILEQRGSVANLGEMVVRPSLGLPVRFAKKADIFVLTPFREKFEPVFKDHITSVAKTLGVRAARAGSPSAGDYEIMAEVWGAINSARVVIADCSEANANVFYEIGLVHVLGKPLVLISQTKLPFDLSHRRYIRYEYTPSGMKTFELELESSLRAILRLDQE